MKAFLHLILLVSAMYGHAQTQMLNMPVTNGDVWSIAGYGNTIFIGGSFTTVNGQARDKLAAFDATTGTLTSLSATFSHQVHSVNVVAGKLIVGGSFYLVNGATHYGMCMFDIATGNLEPWSANGVIGCEGVGISGDIIYYTKGSFSGGGRIEAYDVSSTAYTGWVSDSLYYGDMHSILAYGNYVYAGGDFSFNGGSSVYNDLCRFDITTGALDTSWHPQVATSNYGIMQVKEHKGNIYIGGTFTAVGGTPRMGIAGFNGLTGALTSFNPNNSSSQIFGLHGNGDNIWIAGNSWMMGGASRWRIAEINPANSQATCWDGSAVSNSWGVALSVYVRGDTAYVGGDNEFVVYKGSPQPLISGGISGPSSVAASQFTQYTVPIVPGNNYNWNVTGGTGSSTTNTISITWGTGPAGTVSVVQTNPSASNCHSDTAWLQVAIGTIGLIENNSTDLKIFPSPVNDALFIELLNVYDCTVEIRNSLGVLILTNQINELKNSFDLSKFAAGMYFVTVKQENQTYLKKIIKL